MFVVSMNELVGKHPDFISTESIRIELFVRALVEYQTEKVLNNRSKNVQFQDVEP